MKHYDSLRNIKQIEEKDIIPLVLQGKAKLLHSSQGNHNPDFAGIIASGLSVKVYELLLRTAVAPICFVIQIRFEYDQRCNKGRIAMSSQHALLLSKAFESISADEQRQTIAQMIKYGEEKPVHVLVTK